MHSVFANSDGSRHAVLFSDVRGEGKNRHHLITCPWSAKTKWVSYKTLVECLGNWGRLDMISNPK